MMTQTNEDQVIDGQPRDIAIPAPSSPPSASEDSHQFPPSPPVIHDNLQFSPPAFAAVPSPSKSPEGGEMVTFSPQRPAITHAKDAWSLPQHPLDAGVDPHIASLHARFPYFDNSLPSSSLQSVNGDQDQPLPPPEQHEPTQTDLDGQLARRLMLEEEQAAQNQRRPLQQEQGPQYYHSRRSASRDRAGGDGTGRCINTAQAVSPPQQNTMAEFQDGSNKITETDKKAFSSIFSEFKAKIQEYNQGHGASRQDTQPMWGDHLNLRGAVENLRGPGTSHRTTIPISNTQWNLWKRVVISSPSRRRQLKSKNELLSNSRPKCDIPSSELCH
ncbi:hypothetical protein BD769DRAFT_1690838 [Suillus cothurnatus]|nr:hypothetical protein BD769DRAFT_1690838 [Suillus cothurnatus]